MTYEEIETQLESHIGPSATRRLMQTISEIENDYGHELALDLLGRLLRVLDGYYDPFDAPGLDPDIPF